MEVTIIPTQQFESIHADLKEIKSLLQENNKKVDLNKWLTKKEARLKLKVCMKTLDNYLAKGIMPYSRFGGKIYVKSSDIEAHLERNYISKLER
ncbi:MAG: helix-turn-helix domain-containing protein [Candidatus Coatesbacteria bacterium]|nr:helix-turn-helix domain-containing protein [Candidatus Coatesbacteria bacterium]